MATQAETQPKAVDSGRRPYRFAAEQFWRMIDAGIIPDDVDVELVAGRIYRMTKHEPHNFAVGRLAESLRSMVPQGLYVREEKSMSHDQRTILEPDVAVARGDLKDFRPSPPATSEAALIVEVCASTRTADYRDKVRLYASAGVPLYWVVDVDGRKIDAFSEPQGSGREAGYARQATFLEGQAAAVVLDGREVGRIDAKDLLPPIEPPHES
ncbi:Uma2 family endonuclease [Paludisphaera mucosa]|uniref:Uma2 family endonuclease n=1 Tax=Paludisphaera mucosa TaxID=3030827 RepID=A0ABT6F4E0_9BACT|nr:Uma2 family endonuclease [Paludisphaera mucosa]MDG3002435.1 Uma2 family endonuclease [Paludisphaera mucosa]